jgi:HK97 gp10 family phage protein
VGVLGVEDLVKNLEDLGERVGKAGLRRALYQGAKVLEAEARARAPRPGAVAAGRDRKGRFQRVARAAGEPGRYATGLLAKSIVAESRGMFRPGKRTPDTHIAVVAVRKPRKAGGENARRYAHLVEYGTRPHRIGKGARAARESRKQAAVEKGGLHPGTKAQPFMRPALDTKGDEARSVIARVMVSEVATAAAKRRARR